MPKKSQKFNWFTITNIYRKETIIYYLLTTISCLLSYFIGSNSLKSVYDALKKGKAEKVNYWLKWNFSFFEIEGLNYNFGNSWKKFVFVMLIIIVIYCAIVVAHVYYGYYLANKITANVKRKTAHKLFRLQNPRDKEKSLSVLTHNVRTFASLVVYAPNQLYYWILDLSLVFVGIFKVKGKIDPQMIWLGIGFFLLSMAVVIIFQYFHYKKDLEFQKPLEKETEKEKFLVDNRDLIIKKNLATRYHKNYVSSLQKSHRAENKRDLIFALAFVIPSFSLPKLAPFIFLPFINNEPSWQVAHNLIELAGNTKKMTERLRFYPFGLAAQKQINNFLIQPERNDRQKNVLIEEPVEKITLKKVSFSYVENKPILKKLDWQFQKGKINYLTGENGFGKSTMISLIMGLYRPNKGEIIINNKYRLSEISLVKWRAKIAYAEHENLIENGLSTGQKQLADLNNLLANSEKKEVFIFDEADNALDENNKKEFRQKIEKISKKKLVILISH